MNYFTIIFFFHSKIGEKIFERKNVEKYPGEAIIDNEQTQKGLKWFQIKWTGFFKTSKSVFKTIIMIFIFIVINNNSYLFIINVLTNFNKCKFFELKCTTCNFNCFLYRYERLTDKLDSQICFGFIIKIIKLYLRISCPFCYNLK